MSAGGLSYSGLVNYGVATLPSVETWGTNMNILRDPPKAVMTRRIDKVGETSSLTEELDMATDRSCEYILQYPRGINPMVSVSYQNNGGTNGGANQSGSLTGLSQNFTTIRNGASGQAKLPDNIINEGAYRPPIKTQEQLLPISRQNRVFMSVDSATTFNDFSKLISCPRAAEDTPEVKNQRLKILQPSTYYKRTEQGAQVPETAKFSIQKILNKETFQQPLAQTDITWQQVQEPVGAVTQPIHTQAQAAVSQPEKYVNTSQMNTDKYIQDANAHQVNTQLTDISQVRLQDQVGTIPVEKYIQQVPVIEHVGSRYKNTDGTTYMHQDKLAERKMPVYKADTNVSDISKFVPQQFTNQQQLTRNIPLSHMEAPQGIKREETPRDQTFHLADRLPVGGFDANHASRPGMTRAHGIPKRVGGNRQIQNKFMVESLMARK